MFCFLTHISFISNICICHAKFELRNWIKTMSSRLSLLLQKPLYSFYGMKSFINLSIEITELIQPRCRPSFLPFFKREKMRQRQSWQTTSKYGYYISSLSLIIIITIIITTTIIVSTFVTMVLYIIIIIIILINILMLATLFVSVLKSMFSAFSKLFIMTGSSSEK